MSLKKILVTNKSGSVVNFAEKMEVHQKGLLHRAFSVLIFNCHNEILLQRRAQSKYHSAGLWTNACCGHPFNEKPIIEYAQQRLTEEMGISCELQFRFIFSYCATLENGLIENEIDYVFTGSSNQVPSLNPEEADDFIWINEIRLRKDVRKFPEKYTIWFRIILDYLAENKITFEKLITTKENQLIENTLPLPCKNTDFKTA